MKKPCVLCALDHTKLLRWAKNICRCQEDDAKDLLHDTYLKLGQLPIKRQKEIKNVEFFILTTMKNLWIDKKKKVEPYMVDLEKMSPLDRPNLFRNGARPAIENSKYVSTTTPDNDCLKLLSKLPDAEREAFILYVENQRNLSRVIRRTHIPRLRLKKIIESARKKMEICR